MRPVRSLTRWRACDASVCSTESSSLVSTNRRRRRSSRLAPASKLPTARSPSGCTTQTGGNPFFIEEELIHSLDEAPDAAARVPKGVKDVIGRRLDRLPPRALETLTLAAVLGIDFRFQMRLAAREPASGRPDRLAGGRGGGSGLWSRIPTRSTASRSTHALMRETLYERPIPEPPVPPAPARGERHSRAAPVPAGPGRARASLFPGTHMSVARAKADRVQLESRPRRRWPSHAHEEAADQYERALTALEIVKGYDAAARCDVMLALGRSALAGQQARPKLNLHAGARAGA